MLKKNKYLSNRELAAFCQQIAMILNAGLPTYYGVSILCDEAPDEETRQLLNQIFIPMESGGTLHAAIEATNCFPPYMVHMIELGEETGRLEDVLLSLSSYYDREDTIKASIKTAITYPLVLTTMMLAVIILMVTKILPVFSNIYKELGSDLTGTAKVLMNISNGINKYLLVIILAIVLLFILVSLLFHTNFGKTLLSGKGIALTVASSRFANCMFLALSSGLDTDKGLDLADELVHNPYMHEKIERCKTSIAHGDTFASALLSSGIFSKMYSSWISIGSKTGSMDDIMKHICESYEEETDEKLNHFINILEPTLVVTLCCFIGLILVSFLLPLLGIMSSIG